MDKLYETCKGRFNPEELALLQTAMDYAKQAHKGQFRQSGEDYYTHPEAVAMMLYNMGMDANTVIAGLLHDVVEDGENTTIDDLRRLFHDDIATMVDGVTKLTKTGKTSVLDKEEAQAENLRKMFLAIASDVRVVIIKLNDRLHNMRTLDACGEEKRIRKSKETLEVYAPLAHRFGMGAMKAELEDLAFKYLYPDEFARLKAAIEPQQRERMQTLSSAMQRIKDELQKEGIEAQISGRPKHLYSIYKKVSKNRQLDEIYDLIALRVIMNTISDCYAALGVIHSLWKPVPGRFKDYIAMPKTNMYRSLHTTLFSKAGMPFEVQIRTVEMHRTAEYGIAAHWMYKEGRSEQDDLDSKLVWLRESLELENYSNSAKEFVDNVQKDFFATDCVYVLTPRGEIIDLVAGSTPLDFAYRIHSNVGNRAQHAKVNGAIVRLDYKLKNNDVVEIITSPNATPSRDWLKIVKTQQAKAKIRQWFKKANREENIQRGREMLSDAARRQGLQPADLNKAEYFTDILKRFNMSEMDDAYAAIGYGGVTTSQVLHKLIEQHRREEKERLMAERAEQKEAEGVSKPAETKHGVIVHGDANMAVRFAQCCGPLPGDPIFGYVTRGRGVSVHRKDCPNAAELYQDEDRIIGVEWADDVKSRYTATIQLIAKERPGILMEASQQLANLNISIKTMNAKTDISKNSVTVQMSFDVTGTEQLSSIIKNLKKINGAVSVFRINS